jgi:hypothetical protein
MQTISKTGILSINQFKLKPLDKEKLCRQNKITTENSMAHTEPA